MSKVTKSDSLREAISSAPPISVAGLTLAGVSLQDWVLIATLGWIGLQAAWFVYRRYKDIKEGK